MFTFGVTVDITQTCGCVRLRFLSPRLNSALVWSNVRFWYKADIPNTAIEANGRRTRQIVSSVTPITVKTGVPLYLHSGSRNWDTAKKGSVS